MICGYKSAPVWPGFLLRYKSTRNLSNTSNCGKPLLFVIMRSMFAISSSVHPRPSFVAFIHGQVSELFRNALQLNYLEKPSAVRVWLLVALGSASPRRSLAELKTAPDMVGRWHILLDDSGAAVTFFVFLLGYRFWFWSFR
jgi:hypothetical protein